MAYEKFLRCVVICGQCTRAKCDAAFFLEGWFNALGLVINSSQFVIQNFNLVVLYLFTVHPAGFCFVPVILAHSRAGVQRKFL